MLRWSIAAMVALSSCAKRPIEADRRTPLEIQRERAAVEGVDQTLERARLVSLALAAGDVELADATLRQVVVAMQDFRAEGQFRAMVGAERAKEWKGDPYEKMMAFLYLGVLLLEDGDYGNALAMSKSAILADTGTSRFQYRSDFVPAFVLQALAYAELGERENARRSIEQAVDALCVRVLTDHLVGHLEALELPSELDPRSVDAARVLLLSGLPAGLMAHPRDPEQAVEGALSRATDLRMIVAREKKRDWPDELKLMRRSDAKQALEALPIVARAWRDAVATDPADPVSALAGEQAFLEELVQGDPGLVLWLEAGQSPRKVATGRYDELLQIVPRAREAGPPRVVLDGRPLSAQYLDSTSWQATTRGSRRVDAFLKGKAVFKDSAGALGWALLVSGDVANAMREPEGDSTLATVLYVAGAVTWVAGAIANPAADTRAWTELPDTLWLVRADPLPGPHELVVDGVRYEVHIPDRGTVHHLVPSLPPGGVSAFGEPCRKCEAPLALPQADPPVPGAKP